jgi:hypothetical protein
MTAARQPPGPPSPAAACLPDFTRYLGMCVPTRHSSANRRGVQNIQFRAYSGCTVYALIAAPIGGSGSG